MTIFANQIESITVRDAMREILSDETMAYIAGQHADDNDMGLYDAVEAIANHIVYTDTDFNF